MSTAHHLPPHALNDWVLAASAELGLDPDTEVIKTLLNLARDVAHDVARPAAPLSTFLLGLAVARAENQDAAIADYTAKLTALAKEWEPGEAQA